MSQFSENENWYVCSIVVQARPEKINQVKELLDDIRPFLNMEGGDIEFIKLEDDYVYVKLTGACAMCGYQDVTLKDNILAYIQEDMKEIKGIINVEL